MLAITHLVFALLLIRFLDLDSNEAFLTLLMGVFIDIDHVLALPQFFSNASASGWDLNTALHSQIQWKSAIHDPSAILIVGSCSWMIRLFAPLIAWGAHILFDYIQIYYLGTASLAEMVFLLGLCLSLAILEWRGIRERSDYKPTLTDVIRLEKLRVNFEIKKLAGLST